MNKDKRNNIQLLGTLNNSDESGIIANANQVYDANEDKSTQDVSKEHKERIETLETKESSMQTTLENITKTGEASAASNVTYNHDDSKLDATNVQQAIDEVRKRSNYNDGENIIDFNTIHLITDNPEYICVAVDANDKILYGIKVDGQPYFGAGCPQQVKDYINEKIADLSLDEYEDIVAFLSDYLGSDTTLKAMIDGINAQIESLDDTKVDKEEGKSLIDAEYANDIHYIENPEFAEVKVDNEDRILEAIMKDGTKLLPAGVKVIGTAEYDGATIKTVENPEFVAVWLGTEDKILFGVEQDGNFLFGCGVPKQVKEYIKQKIEELSLDEYESIVAFIGDYLNNTTLEELLSKKVDGEYVDNPEFIEAKTDADDKLIEATRKDGTKVIYGDLEVLGSLDINGVAYRVVSNPEWLKVVVDADDRIICGIKTDGRFVVYVADFLDDIEAIKTRLKELDAYNVTENPEFMEVELDADDKVLGGRKADGTKFENNDVELNGNATVGGSLEVDGVVIKNIEDPDGRHEIILDSENKIISYRRDDGTKVENVGIETPKVSTNSLELTEQGMTDFQKALKDAGFNPGGGGDWSDYISGDGDNPLCIPEPRCAMINITNSSGNFVWPTSKLGQSDYQKGINADKEAIFEFWDMQGNYFKKTINISAQGRSSMVYPKKNAGFDLFDSEYDGDAFSVRFGNWPAMDSYHLKAYYTDFFRGAAIVAYKFAMEVDGTYPVNKDKNWKKALLDKYDFGTCTADGEQLSDLSLQVDTGALCMPDGFPCIVYVNGAFYGVYSFNIKKARDNYHMKKSNPKHIHLDGTLNGDTIFINPNNPSHNTISWGAFEIRNPKNLVYATAQSYTDGGETKTTYKYDADIKQAEIAGNADGSDAYSAWQAGSYLVDVIVEHNGHYFINTVEGNDKEPVYDKSKNADDSPDFKNKTKCGWLNCTNTIKVKNSIIQFSKYWKAIQDKSGAEARREELEKYFDPENLIDYYIVQLVTGDSDGFGPNWQWTTWDGNRWYVNEYDKDMVFGANFTGTFTMPPFMSWVNTDYGFSIFSNVASSYLGVMPYIYNYYKTEIKDRYKELRDKGLITVDNIINKLVDWINRIGVLNLEKEYIKWSSSPCNMLPILNDGWEFYKYESFSEYSSIANYDSSITYNAGDKCKYGYTCFIATKSINGVVPAQRISHCDNIYRIENWLKERIALEDSYLEYNV